MWWLALAVLCSVAVSVLFRLAPRWRLDVPQAVTWNYLAGVLLAPGLLHPPLQALAGEHAPWRWWLPLGLLLPGLFLVLAASVRRAGVVRTDIAQRLSLLLSLIAAFTLFGQRAGTAQLLGLALGLVAIPCLLARPRGGPTPQSTEWRLPLVVLVGWATTDVLFKRIAADGAPLSASLLATFAVAFVPMLGWQLWRHARGVRLQWRSFVGGLALGALNFANIGFYLAAHRALPQAPATVFAAMNIGVVLLGTAVGVGVFGERLGRLNLLAIPLALASIVLISRGMG
ncbi:EamA family transporter [Pseudoxanthomonas winnipegensis]|uniref:EamA/RhaT family transporter n=1 Tax=Pseudoxanthomonas winnipegensis TaxID=2480810 RepID=A0A4V2HEV5_9GAMM|nr:EamA family transporter [Pseudoxanthomonas winnipegensis]RZZ88170.1 EamA/RhaT family transporter [Pseudoxanthomonas winnipegensis]TAA34455.1 EamA/RhaT family transporter [Pseudoxanthomonas winnipegensis]